MRLNRVRKDMVTKILIVVIPISIVTLYFISPWFSVFRTRLVDYWQSWQAREPTVRQMRKYYSALPMPKLSSRQVVAQMVEEKGLLRENAGLVRIVQYYVYRGSKQVIRQLVANLEFEVALRLPEETDSAVGIRGDDTVGRSYSILQNRCGLLTSVSPVLHDELFRYSTKKDRPHLIYLIMGLISSNDHLMSKADSDPDYAEGGGVYYDVDWSTEGLVRRDVLAYLRIYVNYKDWATIRECVTSHFHHYPGEWLDSAFMRDVLSVADEKGVEPAYELFLKSFGVEAH